MGVWLGKSAIVSLLMTLTVLTSKLYTSIFVSVASSERSISRVGTQPNLRASRCSYHRPFPLNSSHAAAYETARP